MPDSGTLLFHLSGVAQGHHHRGDLQALRAGSGRGQARAGGQMAWQTTSPSFPSLRAAALSIHMAASRAPQTEEPRLIYHLLPVDSTFGGWLYPPSPIHSVNTYRLPGTVPGTRITTSWGGGVGGGTPALRQFVDIWGDKPRKGQGFPAGRQ